MEVLYRQQAGTVAGPFPFEDLQSNVETKK